MEKYTHPYPPRAMAADGYEHLPEKMDGSPQEDFYAAKIGFGVDMLLRRPPTVIKTVEKYAAHFAHDPRERAESNLLPRAFDTALLHTSDRYQPLAHSRERAVSISAWALRATTKSLFMDMDADHMWYVFSGAGFLATSFGYLQYGPGDFIYIPKHTLFYFSSTCEMTRLIGVQCEVGFGKPARSVYDNTDVPYNEYVMRSPKPDPDYEDPQQSPHHVLVKRDNVWNKVEYAYSPFLCVAWKGSPYPFAIHASKLNFAYTQTIHADPANFAIFAAHDGSTVVSVLGPRFVHSLPYNHLNQWDEFLFYARKYDARAGSGGGVGDEGTATFHPQGIWHGPQMAALENWQRPESPAKQPWVDDLAIMFESRHPLYVCGGARGLLIPGYENSWREGWEEYQDHTQKDESSK